MKITEKEKAGQMGVCPAEENTEQITLYQENKKRSVLDWFIFGVVVVIAGVVIALSFGNTAKLAEELRLHPYLTAGLVELLFASLLLIRGRQRATQRNVPFFLSIGYFASLAFVTGINMYGLYGENPVVGPIVGAAISGAMWLMESVLAWLVTESDKPHKKSMRELKREAQREIKELKLKQRIEWLRYEAKKPDMSLIKEARREEKKREKIMAEGMPKFFEEQEPPKPPKLKLVPPVRPESEPEPKPEPEQKSKQKRATKKTRQLALF